jgi:hypothetical protein
MAAHEAHALSDQVRLLALSCRSDPSNPSQIGRMQIELFHTDLGVMPPDT